MYVPVPYAKADGEAQRELQELGIEEARMKSDELIEDYCFDATDNQTKAVYPKADVDAAIAELKAENRRLKRALWLARALRARDIQRWWISATCAKITERACSVWNNVERKCREKAESYL